MRTNLGDLVYELRKKNGLTLEELSELSGVNKSVLTMIEEGVTQRPSYGTVKKIAQVPGFPYSSLIGCFIETVKSGDTLRFILEDVVKKNYESLVSTVAYKFLDSPRTDTFLSLDYLLQFTRNLDNSRIKMVLFDTIISYTRIRGIPFYLAKALFERYLAERDDFTRLRETYHRGSELIHYSEHLSTVEYITFFYRIGIHAYALREYDKCIYLCKKALDKDGFDNQLRAEALSSIVASYLNIGDYILADLYLEEYTKSQYSDYKKNHAKAIILTKSGNYDSAIETYKELLESLDRERRITILVDLIEVYLIAGRGDSIRELIESENRYLPSDSVNNPRRIEKMAKYHYLKGEFLISVESLEDGASNYLKSATYYKKIGQSQGVLQIIGKILKSYKDCEEKLPLDIMEKIVQICDDIDK
ncbi:MULTISPECIES: helix-turn-helix domain-containing protein [Brevibacillus]|uniref:helix-turn-helix domain-containing protein n=1 Tax=Brevibacillus TaxID=55080 RepID=UPI000EC5191E|nr:helix-turn-helix domain-containing protein [Brevibacillus sp.]HBZ79860.1 transcriptional regulator [Brevibacillus sp.]